MKELRGIKQGAWRRRRGQPAGTVSVEMAMVAPILITLLFGIIELGLIFRDTMTLNQAAREGVRVAAVGAPTSTILARLQGAAPNLSPDALECWATLIWTGGW